MRDIKKVLSELDFETIDDLVNELSDKLHLAVAVFDENNMLLGINMEMTRCKCYYMLLHQQPTQCSIFDADFVRYVLSCDAEQDILCGYGCRLTMRLTNIGRPSYKVIMFQYNLPADNLQFNSHSDPFYVPLYRGNNSAAIDYFWKPNVLTPEEQEIILNFVVENIYFIKIKHQTT